MAGMYFIVLIYNAIVLMADIFCCKYNSHFFRFCYEWHNGFSGIRRVYAFKYALICCMTARSKSADSTRSINVLCIGHFYELAG